MVDIQGGQSGTQVGGYTLEIVMIAFLTVGLSNSLELLVQIFFQFKQWRGLYFWSMLIATLGIPVYSVGFILKYWAEYAAPWEFSILLIELGWVSFVTGQAVLLYSRLHLVLFSRRILRMILIMIVFDAIVLHSLTIVATYGSNSPDAGAFVVFYTFLEKLQMTWFSLQEAIISGVYIWATSKFLSPAQTRTRDFMRHLIYVNVFVIVLDLVMLGFVYAGSYELETTLKPAIYTIKMKLEFAVLNQLVQFSRASVNQASYTNEMSGRRRSSKFPEPMPREHIFAGGSTRPPPAAGILRTTTVVVDGDSKPPSGDVESASQDCIIEASAPMSNTHDAESYSNSESLGPGSVHHQA